MFTIIAYAKTVEPNMSFAFAWDSRNGTARNIKAKKNAWQCNEENDSDDDYCRRGPGDV
jgi:hypothetical protein